MRSSCSARCGERFEHPQVRVIGDPARLGRRAWLYGCVGGLAPDLDVFIRSSADPLVALEYHRHFTHSLLFIPIGGTLVGLPWALRPRHRARAAAVIAATTARLGDAAAA